MSYDFSIDRRSTVILGVGSVVLVLLVFLAGFLAGMSWRRDTQMAALRPKQITVTAAAPPAPAGVKRPAVPDAAPSAASEPAALPAAVEPKPAIDPPAAPSVAPPAAPPMPVFQAANAIPVAPEQSGVRLSIQVGSFLQKSNAEKLVDQLKHSGYNPQIVLAGIGAKQWNIVRVGPYQDWDEATQIAAQLSRDQAGPAVIRPIR